MRQQRTQLSTQLTLLRDPALPLSRRPLLYQLRRKAAPRWMILKAFWF